MKKKLKDLWFNDIRFRYGTCITLLILSLYLILIMVFEDVAFIGNLPYFWTALYLFFLANFWVN